MVKRRFSLLFLILSAALLLSSCGTKKADEDANVLTLVGKKSDLGKNYLTRVFERYEDATGNELNIVAYDDEEYESVTSELFKEGDVPDLFLHFHNADLARFDIEDNFYYLNDEPWVEELTDSARAYCLDADGHLLGLPFWENSISGCYYNKTLLDSMGLNPAATQKEFDMLCQALTSTGYTPICWPAKGCSWMFQFGMDPIFADDPDLLERLNANEITYADIPQMTDMVQWIADAAEKGWFGSGYMTTGWDEISPALTSGDAVMTFIWDTWFTTDLATDGKYGIDDFALMPVFMNTAPNGTYEGGNLNMMMVNKNSEKLSLALDFLAFCADEENCNAAFEGISTINCFKHQTSNIQSQMVLDAHDSLAANERVSTAASRITGYSADDMAAAFDMLLSGQVDVPECIAYMDQCRMEAAGWIDPAS